MKKLTKKDYFEMLLAIEDVKDNDELVTFVKHELDLLAKKNSGERKPTATQAQNEELKETILAYMETGKKYTISDLMKIVPDLANLTNQRVSALVRQLKENHLVIRIEEKRKAYFQLAE